MPTTRSLPAFLWHFVRTHGWRFWLIVLMPVASVLEATAMPYGMKMIIDAITVHAGERDTIFAMLAPALWLTGATWVVMIILFRLSEWVQADVLPQLQADLRMASFHYTQRHSHRYFSDHFAGSVANKIADMPRAAFALFMWLSWRVVATGSVFLATLALMATVQPMFSLVVLVWVVVQNLIAYALARKIAAYSEKHSEERSTLNGKIVDVLTNIASVRMFARHDHEHGYVGKQQEAERSLNRRMSRAILYMRCLIEVPTTLMLGFTMYLLVVYWQAGEVGTGDFAYVFWAIFSLMHWNWQFSNDLPTFFSELGVMRQAWTVISPEHEVADAPGAPALKVTKGEIVFDKVNFHYRPEYNIFSDKSLTISGGEKVGLVGFSGSGKTTFVHLIQRFFDVESGRILIDGQDIALTTQDSLHAQIAMIPQDTSLFHRTLMENIRYGRLDASDDEVIEASKRADCHTFIMRLPEAYESLVGERGVKLSGGQRQRIAIARAILKNAPILVLDEATSALDSSTEKAIKESLAQLMRGRTTIVIAHRLSTLADMDRILVFDEGHIVEEGSHAQLLNAGGHYAKLWNLQAGGFLPDEKV